MRCSIEKNEYEYNMDSPPLAPATRPARTSREVNLAAAGNHPYPLSLLPPPPPPPAGRSQVANRVVSSPRVGLLARVEVARPGCSPTARPCAGPRRRRQCGGGVSGGKVVCLLGVRGRRLQ